MKRTLWLLGISVCLVVAAMALGAAAAGQQPPSPAGTSARTGTSAAQASAAAAAIEPRSGSKVTGKATFAASAGKVTMRVDVTGLAPGAHAIHLHENGDCSDPEAKAAGGHWNPTKAQHGRWGEGAFHHGDIGNLEADAAGKATLTFATDLWTIGGDPGTNIVGRSVVVHEKVDDFQTQPTGNAGGRVGCGVIRGMSASRR